MKKILLSVIILIQTVLAFFILAGPVPSTAPLAVYKSDGVIAYVRGDFAAAGAGGIAVEDSGGALKVLDSLSYLYGFKDAHSELVPTKVMRQVNGYIYAFDQYFGEAYVYPRGVKVSVDDNLNVESITGNYLRDCVPVNSLRLSAEQAALYAGINALSVRQVIYTLDTEPLYAYEIFSSEHGGAESGYYYINAEDGSVINYAAGHRDAAFEPHESVQTDYHGNPVSMTVAKNNGTYYLIDGYRNINVRLSSSADNGGVLYQNDTGVFDNGTAVSTLKNVAAAFDFYTKEENIGVSMYGIDDSVRYGVFGDADAGAEKQVNVIIFTQWYNDATTLPNSPSERYTSIAFGNRFGVAIDVCAHEYQHSVNNYLAELTYSNASGAVDEALADLFAALVKGAEMSDDSFWSMGEQIPGRSRPLRSAINPEDYGHRSSAENPFPFCYEPNAHSTHRGCDNGGVHLNSTIITHAVYQMYQYSLTHNVESFNKSNLGIMLYNVVQNLPRNVSWSTFARLLMNAPQKLALSTAEKVRLSRCIGHGFSAVGITAQNTVTFSLDGLHEGTPPAPITVVSGEGFVIPDSDVSREGYPFIGWALLDEVTGNPVQIFYAGQSYDMPFFDMTLYPYSQPPRWNDFEFTGWDGNGTQGSPYLIKTPDDLAALGYYMNNGNAPPEAEPQEIENAYFAVTADLDLDEESWYPIGNSESTVKTIYFDGRGHSISSLVVSGDYEYAGLFGIFSGEISNLRLAGGEIDVSATAAGSFAGFMLGGSSISDCYNSIPVANARAFGSSGGIIGMAYNVSIINCINAAAVIGQGASVYIGGIVGLLTERTPEHTCFVEISGCKNSFPLTIASEGSYAGGIIGFIEQDAYTYSFQKNFFALASAESVGACGNVLSNWAIPSQDAGSDFNFTSLEYYLNPYYFAQGDGFALYALFNADEDKGFIYFMESNGTLTDAVQYDLGALNNLPTPTKNRYRFTGWYYDAALTNKAEQVTVIKSLKLYAGWEEITPDGKSFFERYWIYFCIGAAVLADAAILVTILIIRKRRKQA